MPASRSTLSNLIALILVAVLAIIGYRFLTMPDQRSTTDRLGDAIHALPNGPEQAERALEDRTPGQKLGDAIKDAGEKIKEETGSKE